MRTLYPGAVLCRLWFITTLGTRAVGGKAQQPQQPQQLQVWQQQQVPPATHKGQSHPDATYLPTAIDPVIVAEMTPTEWAQGGRGLGSCFDDWEVCFWGTFFSCCLYGQIKVRSGRATQCNTAARWCSSTSQQAWPATSWA